MVIMNEKEIDQRAANIAQILATTRAANGITLRALEQRTGINNGNLSRIERGDLMPRIDTLLRITDALGIKSLPV